MLEVRNLKTYFYGESGTVRAVDGVDFEIRTGEVLGLVGESGSGKSVTALSILRLIADPPGKIVDGSIVYKDQELLKLSWEQVRNLRGKEISMIFQEPRTSLNPVFTIGEQVMEVILRHETSSRREAFDRAVRMLESVGIPQPASRMKDYPHQFSGGMCQRVMIAIALACNPSLLIADEPTTALDVTIQAQILELMLRLKEERREAAILLITHNLAVIAETCDRVIVMYGGKIQEVAPVKELFGNPLHPYTQGLLGCLPTVEGERARRLPTIAGNVPSALELPPGCKFTSRCGKRLEICGQIEPPLRELSPGHWVRCHLYEGHGFGA
ncbi:MAG: ABC transporter ATP-binding protein [Acidobacteria bacterium]|nr:ABC transporter ATP-binding protein [Acidobacteriota bacterium]